MLCMFLPCIGQDIATMPDSMSFATWRKGCRKEMTGGVFSKGSGTLAAHVRNA